MSNQVRLLAQHFLWRFLDNDLISPDSDIHESGVLVLTFLAVPSLLCTGLLLFTYANPWVTPYERMLLALPDKLLFICWSMLIMALVTLVDWDALSLDARDYAILGPLPIAARTLLAGKLAALALFIGAVVLAVNLVPTVFFPFVYLSSSSVSLPLPYSIWLMLAHAAACGGAALFGFVAVLVLRGVLINLLGPGLFRRVSIPVQFVAGLALVIGFAWVTSAGARYWQPTEGAALAPPPAVDPALYWSPPMWFLGIYETMTAGTMAHSSRELKPWQVGHNEHARLAYRACEPMFHQLAFIAVMMLAVAAFLGFALYFSSHFGRASHLRGQTSPPVRRRRLAGAIARLARALVVRDPLARASFFFTLQTLARSARHKLYLSGYVAAGGLVIYLMVAPLLRAHATASAVPLSVRLLSIQFVLSFFLLVGLRVIFTIPAELRANWVFRLTAVGAVWRSLRGVRRAVAVAVVLPFFALLLPMHALLWGCRLALLHAGYGVLWAFVLVEVLLLGLEKLPFTCSHVRKGGLKLFWPFYVLGFVTYSYAFARAEQSALRTGSPALAVFLAVALAALVAYRSRLLRKRTQFIFSEAPDSATISLEL